ncbi:MAG: prepilin peptidase [Betaproteobacteria bacterium]|nr:prepilin peptidase [Betaproteobacteria bacterium]
MSQSLVLTGAALLGLLLGSFGQVVVHRLPRMMERQWAREARDWLAEVEASAPPPQDSAPYNLARPGSHCPACGHQLPWYEMIPVLSYLFLRGRCSACGQAIGWRSPLLELAVAGLCVACVWRWGLQVQALAWAGVGFVLLILACIDWDTQLLPDSLTLPLIWSGLIATAVGWTGLDLQASLWGAVVGYLLLWGVHQMFLAVTGRQGMGQGDFKLLAALGAWLGWPALLPLVLIASVSGLVLGVLLRVSGRLQPGEPLPFGPALAVAGGFLMFWPERFDAWLWF